MRRACARSIASAARSLETAVPPRRVAARALSISMPALVRTKRSAILQSDIGGGDVQAGPSVQAELRDEPSAYSGDDELVPEDVPLANEQYISSWTSIGVPEIITRRLLTAYPHIQAPTPAQRALILSVAKGVDVFLKDEMGRGKTLGIAIAVASLAYKANSGAKSTIRQLVLLPSAHLVRQVERDLLVLDPSFFHAEFPLAPTEERGRLAAVMGYRPPSPKGEEEEGTEDKDKAAETPTPSDEYTPPILVTTPQDLMAQRSYVNLDSVSTIFADEPDSLLPPIPAEYVTGQDLRRHPINRHPTPFMQIMNELLNIEVIKTEDAQTSQKRNPPGHVSYKLSVSTSNRRNIQTIWTSGTMDATLKRFAKGRGWIRKRENLVDLVYTSSATKQQLDVRAMAERLDADSQVRTEPITSIYGVQPTHYALRIDSETGAISDVTAESIGCVPKDPENAQAGIEPTVLEALAMIHASSPPPEGSYALAVPPEGISNRKIVAELADLGIPSIQLHAEILPDVDALASAPGEIPPVLLARRSAVPGLNLPRLHTIYMINGLDVATTFKPSVVKEKVIFYSVAAGRVGRLGMNDSTQRVISLVTRETREEHMLGELFYGRHSTDIHGRDKGFKLKEWDVGTLRDAGVVE